MKYTFNIEAVPGQSFTTTLNNHDVQIDIISVRDLLVANVTIDNVLMMAGSKCVPNVPFTTGPVEAMIGGTMYFVTQNHEYPVYGKLGTSDCVLVFEEA